MVRVVVAVREAAVRAFVIVAALKTGVSPVPRPNDVRSVAPDSRTGSPEPSPTMNSPSPKTPVAVNGPDPEPRSIPPSVNVAAPVPPLLTARVEVEVNWPVPPPRSMSPKV